MELNMRTKKITNKNYYYIYYLNFNYIYWECNITEPLATNNIASA